MERKYPGYEPDEELIANIRAKAYLDTNKLWVKCDIDNKTGLGLPLGFLLRHYFELSLIKKEGREIGYVSRNPIAQTISRITKGRAYGDVGVLNASFKEAQAEILEEIRQTVATLDEEQKPITFRLQTAANILSNALLQHKTEPELLKASVDKIIETFFPGERD